ncbi:MAG: hypothetical protein WCO63_15275 [Bacteroidota bacterium]
MALPTASNLTGLDFVYLGKPFCQVPARSDINTNGLDVVELAKPFWAVSLDVAYNIKSVGTVGREAIYKIGGVLWSGLNKLGKVIK